MGADIAESLSKRWNVKRFNEQIPDCDLFVFIKYKLVPDILRRIAQRSSIIYCLIDFYPVPRLKSATTPLHCRNASPCRFIEWGSENAGIGRAEFGKPLSDMTNC